MESWAPLQVMSKMPSIAPVVWGIFRTKFHKFIYPYLPSNKIGTVLVWVRAGARTMPCPRNSVINNAINIQYLSQQKLTACRTGVHHPNILSIKCCCPLPLLDCPSQGYKDTLGATVHNSL